jgi:hypothetical protein
MIVGTKVVLWFGLKNAELSCIAAILHREMHAGLKAHSHNLA